MRTPAAHRVMSVTVTVLALEPAVRRELVVDPHFDLGALHEAIALSFGWPSEHHHVFTDRLPDLRLDGELPLIDGVPWRERSPSGWGRPRRWGDKWTMIDWRDPSVVDETAVTVESVLTHGGLFYASGASGLWWCLLEARADDDIVSPKGPLPRLSAGSGQAPVPGGPDQWSLQSVHDILGDPGREEHALVASALQALVGPWAAYSPATADLELARRDLLLRFGNGASSAAARAEAGLPPRGSTLDAILASIPPAMRAGFRRHLVRARILESDDADGPLLAETVQGFCWLLAAMGEAGLEFVDGALPRSVVERALTECGRTEAQLGQLVEASKRWGLARVTKRRLVPAKRVFALRDDPVALGRRIASQLLHRRVPRVSTRLASLFLLAIADRTQEETQVDLNRVARWDAALGEILASHGTWWGEDPWHPWPDSSESYGDGWYQTRPVGRRYGASSPRPDTSEEIRARLRAFAGVLEPMGLENTGEGWTVSPAVRALAREALLSGG